MIIYPDEWRKYMIHGKVRTFVPDVPKEIAKKAKDLNRKHYENTGKDFFHFETKKD